MDEANKQRLIEIWKKIKEGAGPTFQVQQPEQPPKNLSPISDPEVTTPLYTPEEVEAALLRSTTPEPKLPEAPLEQYPAID